MNWSIDSSSTPARTRPESTIAGVPHVSVCVCTYRRPELLSRLLAELARQETHGLFTYSVVVVDNDRAESARPVVARLARGYPAPIVYCVEPEQGIARARNRAVAAARGEFVAFIDDDEIPIAEWLLILFNTCRGRGVDGVLGPVKSRFDTEPPRWIQRCRFYDRVDHPDGMVIAGAQGRTGNVLLRSEVFRPGEQAFNPRFVTGEDQDFFRRKIAEGRVFVWSRHAVAYEIVPPARWTRSYVMRRALMRGRYSVLEPSFGARTMAKSALAVCLYAPALPVLGALGEHHFMRYLDKLCYHAGRILGYLHVNPLGGTYVSE